MFPAFFWAGLALVGVYWFSIHPPDFNRLGYVEDIGGLETVRQIMAENLSELGHPSFKFDQYMAPYGVSAPFMSWSIERDWFGALAWNLNPDFPFFWAYFGVSLVLTYVAVGWLLGKMGFSERARWVFSAFVTLFHVPRHYKIWHHFEHLPQHWVYLAVFSDALIWHRLVRERRWSWVTEAWRAVVLIGVFWSTGYHWGPMIIQWAVVRAWIVGYLIWNRWRRKDAIRVEGSVRAAVWPALVGIYLVIVDLRWFSALYEEVKGIGGVFQAIWYYANYSRVFQPLWLETLLRPVYWFFPNLPHITPIDTPETVVTVGWTFWLPFFGMLWFTRKRRGGAGWVSWAPLGVVLVLWLMYLQPIGAGGYQEWVRRYLPFMEFFRVASRMGLFFPSLLGAIVALGWPELTRWLGGLPGRRKRVVVGTLAAVFVLEAPFLAHPINVMPAMPRDLRELLAKVKEEPGDLVLDFPFCVAGGNGVCTAEQCPNYPYSTAGIAFHAYHFKRVFGLYQARMLAGHCQVYNRAPYVSWFDAWRSQRCLTDQEWVDFCGFLDSQPSLSAVFLYPDIWVGVGQQGCREKWDAILGPPKGQARFKLVPTRGGEGANETRLFWYAPRCHREALSVAKQSR